MRAEQSVAAATCFQNGRKNAQHRWRCQHICPNPSPSIMGQRFRIVNQFSAVKLEARKEESKLLDFGQWSLQFVAAIIWSMEDIGAVPVLQ